MVMLVGIRLAKRRYEQEMGDNIEMDLSETGCEYGRWMLLIRHLVQRRALVLRVSNLRVC